MKSHNAGNVWAVLIRKMVEDGLMGLNKDVKYDRRPSVVVWAGLRIELVLKGEVCVKPL